MNHKVLFTNRPASAAKSNWNVLVLSKCQRAPALILLASLLITGSRSALPFDLNFISSEMKPGTPGPGERRQSRKVTTRYDNQTEIPLTFVANRGQARSDVKYLASGSLANLYFTRRGVVFWPKFHEATKTPTARRSPILMTFLGARSRMSIDVDGELQGTVNVLRGKQRSWIQNIPTFSKLVYRQVYDKVDAVFYGNSVGFEYDLEIAPGGTANKVKIAFEGSDSVLIEPDGSLRVNKDGMHLKFHKPIAYQSSGGVRSRVDVHYIKTGERRIGFQLGDYDKTREVVIDPVFAFSTFLGGSDFDNANGIAVASDGSIVVVGVSNSMDYPLANPYQPTMNGTGDVIITKINPSGSSIAYSTFLGGLGSESGSSVGIDASGRVYIAGRTSSPDFPLVNPVQPGVPLGNNGFISVLNSSGNALEFSTCLGGAGNDWINSIDVNQDGAFAIAGLTESSDFPTHSAFQPNMAGRNDAFVARFSPTWNLIFSTYLGGAGFERANTIDLDVNGNSYIGGSTGSPDFPVVLGLQPNNAGSDDIFITKLTPSGGVAFSTYVGGSGSDSASDITVDTEMNVYLTGYTTSTNFPTVGGGDAFVAKLLPSGAGFAFFRIFGGSMYDSASALAFGNANDLVVVGTTISENFPLLYPLQSNYAGFHDAFMLRVNRLSGDMLSATYLGGEGDDQANSVATDSRGNPIMLGLTRSADFPVTPGQKMNNGDGDIFLTKVRQAPEVFDFDGDGKTDIGIFRPNGSASEWWMNRSSTGATFALQFGSSTDKIAPADYTGDGKTDIAFWRPSDGHWYVLRSEDFSFFAFPFGTNGDIPVPADYDADAKADAAVFRPSTATWFISQSSGAPTRIFQFGATGDQPVVADYDGDGKADVGIFRPGPREWWIQRSTAGLLATQFGNVSDKAVQGDYTGDGKTDIAIWRPATGEWLIVRSEDFSFYGFPFGASTDIPAPGDYDGDGKFDATVFRPSNATWFIGRTTSGTLIVQFGSTGDRPIPNAYVP
jgi:hypothetical protein